MDTEGSVELAEVRDVESFGKRDAHEFCFRDCRFTVSTKAGEKSVLKGITGSARSGEVLAIMGPSGAGKTQLMNLLSLIDGPGAVSGDVTLNGKPFTRELFMKYAGQVPQADFHWAFLTCRETVQVAADLLNIPQAEREKRVAKIMKRTGLEGCSDVRVGNQFIPGLSGGQKRRLSLAVLLIRRPALVFLDEPTSGLDAAAACQIMNFVAELARDLHIIVVATIHQPSATVFAGFHGAMVLSDGRVAYQGAAQSLITYLDRIEKPLPSEMGVAEWCLDLVNREFTDPTEVDRLLDVWSENEAEFCGGRGEAPPPTPMTEVESLGSSMLHEVAVLLKRHAVLTIRDPTIYLGRAFVNLFACLFFSIVYIESRNYNQEQATYHMFLVMWLCGVPACMGIIAVFAFNIEFHSIKAEVKNGMYRATSYLVAKSILEVPMMFILSIFAISCSAYGVSNYNGDYYFEFMLVFTAMLWSFECMAQAMSVSFDNPLLGAMGFMNMWFCSFLFAGIMVPEKDVPWPFKAMIYLFPFRYSLASLIYLDFHDTTFDGAYLDANDPRGYSCTDSTTWCYGYTGKQVLDSLGQTYKTISSEDHTVRDFSLLLAIGAFFKLQYLVIFVQKSAAHRVPIKTAIKA
ncbi:hypothetical protein CYMTET_7438 [Cymbomonas tetramitiformis]|uniref:ABC transporter domain-containing protein n=1 Tax=Cymbomonas tetramitiformis TaxID=36881 RepID=A0AAE0GV02_9CHLO|nr:hypothetical protein CYMTET_7438 [Cymbomonas tetramitiformis]|eukprot:gene14894-17607_t